MEGELEGVTAAMTELEEEQGGDDGAFSDLDKVNRANVSVRLKEIREDKDAAEETAVLDAWLKLSDRETALKRAIKEADAVLDARAILKYPALSQPEVQTLVVDDKWLAALDAAIQSELDRISQLLTQRVKVLAERYETPLPQMASSVAEFDANVNRHLVKMGFAWK